MAWSTIRKATNEDYEALERINKRYAEKYAPDSDYLENLDLRVECAIENYHGTYGVFPDWKYSYRRAIRKALGDGAEGIAWDYVGYEIE